MRAQIKTLVAVAFGVLLLSSAVADDGITITYKEPLQQYRLGSTHADGSQKASPGTARSMSFDAFGRRFDINLEENRSLFRNKQRFGNHYDIYRGDIAGIAGSWVRLVIADGLPRGMLWDGVELWAINVGRDPATSADSPFMFRLSDLEIPPGMLACSDVGIAGNAGELAKAVMSDLSSNASKGPGATEELEIAVIADYEFTSDKGANTDAALITRMNNVDGIFSMQLGVQLSVTRIDSYPSNNDPFTDQLNASSLLDELTDYRDATPAQYSNGLSHLFTGRNLETTTVGVAYTGALCSRRFGAGLTQGTHDVTTDTLIAAHELGHNFGAPHDGTTGSACESETGDFLMAPRINGVDQFSSCSITQIQDDVNRASCITPLPSTDVAMLAGGQSGAVLLGNDATVVFDANSVGTDTANNVSVDVTIPVGVTLRTASATTGNCTIGAGTASCAIGTVAGGSGATITLTATTSAVGNADFVATASAASDADGGNDQATVRITVDPAVDLIATAAAGQVVVDRSMTLRPNIENRSAIAATNVSVTVTPDAGFSIDTASWAAGTCSIVDNVATCQSSSLAAQSTAQLQLGVTGLTTGSRSYTMVASADETDRNTANNSASAQLTVSSATSGSAGGDDSGGGATDWLSLLALLLFVVRIPHLLDVVPASSRPMPQGPINNPATR